MDNPKVIVLKDNEVRSIAHQWRDESGYVCENFQGIYSISNLFRCDPAPISRHASSVKA